MMIAVTQELNLSTKHSFIYRLDVVMAIFMTGYIETCRKSTDVIVSESLRGFGRALEHSFNFQRRILVIFSVCGWDSR